VLDTTQPPISEISRTDFTVDYPLIQADLEENFTSLDAQLAREVLARVDVALTNRRMDDIAESSNYIPSAIDNIHSHQQSANSAIRNQITAALLPLVETNPQHTYLPSSIGESVLEGAFTPIVEDVAPYVRSIVASELELEDQRLRLSGLLSQGIQDSRKIRKTRAARSALEGGRRATTRPERWFAKDLNYVVVLRTGGQSWRPDVSSTMGTRESSVDELAG
jgi:sorting nexin-8